jgi:hypothetical protein
MIEWFRWWHGTVTDPKFRWIAKKSNSKITDVLAVWAALLEHASNVTQCNADETRGNVTSFQCEDWDIQFDLEEGQTQKILSAMESKGLIENNEICNWQKRQPKREDSSTERVRRFREKKKTINNCDDETQCNAKKRQETLDTDTDTDIYTNNINIVSGSQAEKLEEPNTENLNGSKNFLKDDCPHLAIISLYHEVLPSAIRVRNWKGQRQTMLRQRWRENAERQNLDWWRKFFQYIAESDFLTGKVFHPDRGPMKLKLHWIVKPANFDKILDGDYENR